MATTIHIIITGVAICYKKPQGGGINFWRVLFPFDDLVDGKRCHNLNFKWRIDNNPETNEGPLAGSMREINITVVTGDAASTTDSTDDFNEFALDLTNTNNTNRKPITHERVNLISGWDMKTALMKIDVPAQMDVVNYVPKRDGSGKLAELVRHDGSGGTSKQPLRPTAHDVMATITLPQDSFVLRVGTDSGLNRDFTGGGVFTLVFDNDCLEIRPGMNDMDMFYENTISGQNPPGRFLVGDRAPVVAHSIPPNFAEGKPCLVVEVSDPNGLPD